MRQRLVAFFLSMPGRNSWNGGWSGEERCYAIVRSVEGGLAEKIAEKGCYSYSWSDGWRASIDARIVDHREAAKIRKKSDGFSGYDWMVSSIISHGMPLASHELEGVQ